ncbi:purple acid phosphatase family protein [Cyclobacterium plantarum]|uniref:Metallophosphoesterase family protein n=1 Tax=Cyclobacterium plantarum TaxID=2716263 RepID=A0ABX0HGD3_9BACT|nr:metallophosphoesterase family protein [Cyclobacterium plantarum]NHE59090.1 metallophosphoesterase family protein [Cyclobacterium plantarum]
MKKITYAVLWLNLILVSCSPDGSIPNNLPPVSETMDGIVSRLYAEWDKETLDTISHEFIEQYLSEEEKAALATQYWKMRVNVPVTVSLMRDKAQKKIPFWLEPSGFTRTDMEVKNGIYTYEVWQKDYDSGRINLGINGFGKHRPVYFVALAPQNQDEDLEITPIFPEDQHIEIFKTGAFTYHDWDGLTLTQVPEALEGQQLLTTIRGRAREAHLVNAFRTTDFPTGQKPDQVVLTWSGDPASTMDIQWRADETVTEGFVKYWSEKSTDTLTSKAEKFLMEDRLLQNDRYMHRFTANLQALNPDTKYEYMVGNDAAGWSSVETFSTAAREKKAFSFTWFGDIHNSAIWGDLIKKSEKQHPGAAFYFSSGDLVDTGLNRDDWDKLFAYAGGPISRKPFLAVPGNHDSQDGLGAWMYEEMLSLPSDSPNPEMAGRTYAFNYQNTLFLMIDATLPLSHQTAWIEEKLSGSEATWKIAVFHFPPYNAVEPYPEIQDLWGPLFDEYHVDMVLGGHFHYYMRSKPIYKGEVKNSPEEGTIYWISIGTTGKNKGIDKESYAEIQFSGEHLYQYVTIDGDQLNATTINLEGETVDQFSINK